MKMVKHVFEGKGICFQLTRVKCLKKNVLNLIKWNSIFYGREPNIHKS